MFTQRLASLGSMEFTLSKQQHCIQHQQSQHFGYICDNIPTLNRVILRLTDDKPINKNPKHLLDKSSPTEHARAVHHASN